MMRKLRTTWHSSLTTLLLLSFTAAGAGATWPSLQNPAPETASAELTPEQRTRFDQASKACSAGHWTEALPPLESLHRELPQNITISRFLAEAEINTEQPAKAIALLKPVLEGSPDDSQALAIAAHAYAQSGQGEARDSTLAHLQHLHDAGSLKMQQLLVERDALPNQRSIAFFYFLEPWSRFHIAVMARIYDAGGRQTQRITLESDDFDQPGFAKAHPAEASRGEREYSMDGYVDQPGADGGVTQTHSTYAFFVGKPDFDTFHQRAIAAAEGKLTPMSSTSGIQVKPTQ